MKIRISAPAHPSATGIGRVSGLVFVFTPPRLSVFLSFSSLLSARASFLLSSTQAVDTIHLEIFDERAFAVDDRIAWADIVISPQMLDGSVTEVLDDW